MSTTIHVRATRADVRRRLAALPAILAGKAPDPSGVAPAVARAVGEEALAVVREAFGAKSRGGVDEAGQQWAPLDPKYVAYGRQHGGVAAARGRAARTENANRRPLLSTAQDRRWRQLYARMVWTLMKAQGVNGLQAAPPAVKAHAAAYAWTVVKLEGGKTILGTYGGARVAIGVKSGALLESLEPGAAGNVLRVEPGAVVIGSDVPHARHFHRRRRLWPEPGRWPASWRRRLSAAGLTAALAVAQSVAGEAGR